MQGIHICVFALSRGEDTEECLHEDHGGRSSEDYPDSETSSQTDSTFDTLLFIQILAILDNTVLHVEFAFSTKQMKCNGSNLDEYRGSTEHADNEKSAASTIWE